MAAVTRGQLIALTREAMDADSGDRWSPTFLLAILNGVFGDEWSNILNASPYYNFAERAVVTDVSGRVPFSALNAGAGDSQQNFYRLLSLNDGVSIFDEGNYRDYAGATFGQAFPQSPKMYYVAGTFLQALPVVSGLSLTAVVNWKPTALTDLANDSSVVEFPEGNEMLLACEAAGRALEAKAGAEENGAQALFRSAQRYRADFLDDLTRRSINPRTMGYSDRKGEWAG